MPRLRILAIVQNAIYLEVQPKILPSKVLQTGQLTSVFLLETLENSSIVQNKNTIAQNHDFQILYCPNLDNSRLSRGIGYNWMVPRAETIFFTFFVDFFIPIFPVTIRQVFFIGLNVRIGWDLNTKYPLPVGRYAYYLMAWNESFGLKQPSDSPEGVPADSHGGSRVDL